ncbi:MAG TPA: DUF2786 domain-containing protein [Streptosporangiaceae bacterium]|nr:DUF2786 domain-containing protein [Streptosporangiaceae bacterium]
MSTENVQLDRIRKLLAQAEDTGVTSAEAEVFTAKAAELMARYGIDRALLAATQPGSDQPADRIITVPNPWAAVHAHLLSGIASAMRCRCILPGTGNGARVHVFGYASDIERAEVLYTSLLVQMHRALAATLAPEWTRSARAWRRSWMLGYCTSVIARVRAAEQRAARDVGTAAAMPGAQRTAIVLASRDQVIAARAHATYPVTRKTRTTYSGTGYRDGYAKGNQADIGTTRLNSQPRRSLR